MPAPARAWAGPGTGLTPILAGPEDEDVHVAHLSELVIGPVQPEHLVAALLVGLPLHEHCGPVIPSRRQCGGSGQGNPTSSSTAPDESFQTRADPAGPALPSCGCPVPPRQNPCTVAQGGGSKGPPPRPPQLPSPRLTVQVTGALLFPGLGSPSASNPPAVLQKHL